LTIAEIGDPVLRAIAQPVPPQDISTQELQSFLANLVETMRARSGVGLAAPQVRCAIRVVAVECDNNPRYPDAPTIPLQIWINPEILETSAQACPFTEGCLSLPEQRMEVWRPDWIRLRALNPTGQTVEFTATGFLARVLQHEIDHLNGILFVDRLPATARNPIAAISLETGSR
jgi:peptide deformylase